MTSTLAKVYSEIFPFRPVLSSNRYIVPSFLEPRKSMRFDHFGPHKLPDPFGYQLPNWLEYNRYLPPWEQRLLAQIATVKSTVFTLKGGAGCGKTSTVSFLYDYCQRAIEGSKSRSIYSFKRPPVMRIDLEGVTSLASVRARDQEVGRRQSRDEEESLVQTVLTHIVDSIDTELDSILSMEQWGDLFKTAIESPRRGGTFTDVLANTSFRIKRSYRTLAKIQTEGLGDTTNQEAAKKALRYDAYISADFNVELQLLGRILLLLTLGSALGPAKLIVFLDNIDPLPEYIQRRLLQIVTAATFAIEDPSVVFAIFCRLSSAAAHQGQGGAMQGGLESADIFSPEPATIIFYRCAAFLINQGDDKEYPEFNLLQSDQQADVRYKVCSLWRHLADEGGDFRKVLSGLAGTNIRNACEFAAEWCQSSRLPANKLRDWDKKEEVFSEAAAAVTLKTIATNLARGCRRLCNEDSLTSQMQQTESLEAALAAVAGSFSKFIAQTLEEFMLMESSDRRAPHKTPFLAPEYCVRSKISKSAIRHASMLLDLLKSKRAVGKLRAKRVKVDSLFMTLTIQAAQVMPVIAKLFGVGAPRSLLGMLRSEMKVHRQRCEEEKNALGASLIETILAYLTRAASTKLADAGEFNDNLLRNNLGTFLNKVVLENPDDFRESRFEATRALISPNARSFDDKATRGACTNVYIADTDEICPVCLYTLTHLQINQRPIYGKTLGSNLRKLDFRDEQILATWRRMVSVDRRLIYSGVRDADEGVEDWLENPTVQIYLSNAGLAYLRDVIPSPAYIQWVFSEISQVVDSQDRQDQVGARLNIRQRIATALAGFETTIELEIDRASRLQGPLDIRKSNTKDFVYTLCPTWGIFLRSWRGFLIPLLSHRQTIVHKGFPTSDAMDDCLRWLEFFDSVVSRLMEKLAIKQDHWAAEKVKIEDELTSRTGVDWRSWRR